MSNKGNQRIGSIVDQRIDSDEDSRLNGHVNILANKKKPAAPQKRRTGLILTIIAVLGVLVSVVMVLFSVNDNGAGAQAQPGNAVTKEMIEELRKEQKVVADEKLRLQQYEQNLKNFESELDRKFTEYLQKEKLLAEKEELFNKKVMDKTVDRQTLETYENIDPEQAAQLVMNLYVKDPPLATLLMRKMTGKKAGKILEAMVPIDKEIATQLAKQTLDYFKPAQQ